MPSIAKMNVKNSVDLENILSETGEFGPQQMVTVLLLMILNTLTGATFMMYIFSSNTLDHRYASRIAKIKNW